MFGEQNVPMSRKMFDKHDTDKSGCISTEELRALCHELGHHLSDEEFALALVKLDTSGDHKISYDEFKVWWSDGERRWQQLEPSEEEMAKLQQAVAYFDYFDKDKSGQIDETEFRELYGNLVEHGMLNPMPEQTASQNMRSSLIAMDKTGSGGITFNEYVDWLQTRGVFGSSL
tara:strand:- start:320 stop:838 length:519 start_codon:yes stop_codon:yes gene_type:complete